LHRAGILESKTVAGGRSPFSYPNIKSLGGLVFQGCDIGEPSRVSKRRRPSVDSRGWREDERAEKSDQPLDTFIHFALSSQASFCHFPLWSNPPSFGCQNGITNHLQIITKSLGSSGRVLSTI
jgi:hypothetical protein